MISLISLFFFVQVTKNVQKFLLRGQKKKKYNQEMKYFILIYFNSLTFPQKKLQDSVGQKIGRHI